MLGVQIAVASECIMMASDILVMERSNDICVGIVHTGFHTKSLAYSANPLFF